MNKKKWYKQLEEFQETHINEKYKDVRVTVVLIQPETAGNVGSVARIMKNFDYNDLVIFNPIERVENLRSYETQGFAMHGKDILLNAKIINVDNPANHIIELRTFLKNFDFVIATTSQGMRSSNIRRIMIFPDDWAIPLSSKPLEIAILFGKESHGLTNDEIDLADISMRIPTGNEYPSLNLSHACGLILYEIFKKLHEITYGRGAKPHLPADREDRQVFYRVLEELVKKIRVRTHKKEIIFHSFKNVFERAFLSKKELSLITGFFSKIDSALKELKYYDNSTKD